MSKINQNNEEAKYEPRPCVLVRKQVRDRRGHIRDIVLAILPKYPRPVGDEKAGDNFVDDVAVPHKTYKKITHGANNLYRNETTQEEKAAKNQKKENVGLQAI